MSNIKKCLVIIGGTSGIGWATAKLAAKDNMDFVITGFSSNQGLTIKNALPNGTEIYQLDIANEQAIIDFFKHVGQFDCFLLLILDRLMKLPKRYYFY